MNNFINELKSLNIDNQLDKELTGDPNENYQLLSCRLNAAREKHMPRKRVKYKKKLHKKSKWITNGILRSINKKDMLYKTLKLISSISKKNSAFCMKTSYLVAGDNIASGAVLLTIAFKVSAFHFFGPKSY